MAPLEVGYSQVEMVPPLPFPLAGIVQRTDRLAGWVQDPPQATAVGFAQGTTRAALLVLDLLIIDGPLYRDLQARARQAGFDGLYAVASHTHSGPGGYVDAPGARYFMGGYRPELRDFILDRAAAALAGAAEDLRRVTSIHHGREECRGLTMNRRRRGGPTDDTILAARFARDGGADVLLAAVSGHPVVAAFTRPEAASADFPAVAARRLRAEGFLPCLLPGALGGLNILFPEMPTDPADHQELLGRLVADTTLAALASSRASRRRRLALTQHPLAFRQVFPPLAGGPPGIRLRALATAAVGHLYARWSAPAALEVAAMTLRAGPVFLAGMPADFGVGATLHLRGRLTRAGIECPMVTSQSNGYLGYLHLDHEHRWHSRARAGFLLYENAMNWYGADTAHRLIEATVAQAAPMRSQA